ncbi:hypothetical protein P261_02859 [Lachnospiraceae bacterium TWA4]|nr:hypothetical protein P261_02859 [Lachnospiraceae bacterium TWA4]
MILTITVVENNYREFIHLENELNEWCNGTQTSINIKHYPSGEEFFKSSKIHKSDLVFLDIQLDGINGVEIAKELRKNGYQGYIIF